MSHAPLGFSAYYVCALLVDFVFLLLTKLFCSATRTHTHTQREREREREAEMAERKEKKKNAIAVTGAAAFVALAVGFVFSAIIDQRRRSKKKRDVPGLQIRVNLSASEISKLADRVISNSKEVHDSVASVPLHKVTYMNTVSPLAELEAEQFPLIQTCLLHKMVSCSEDVRKASANAEKKIDAHLSMCSKRDDVYRSVKALATRDEWMSSESKCYIFCLLREFERNGVNLASSKREELDRLREKIDELSYEYIQNMDEDCDFLLFSEEQLAGMPSEFIKMLDRKENGKLKISLRSHHTSAILEHCKVGATRKAVAVARGQRCGSNNMQILEKLVKLRHRLARLLGYSNFADFALDLRMPKTSAKVIEFLEDISATLEELAARELALLKTLKKMEEGDFPFGMEDLLYYIRKSEDEDVKISYGVAKKYFPIGLVVSGVLKIFQELFGLIFKEIKGAHVWHNDVQLFSALDVTSHELLGYFYLDLYTREGKYDHMCVLPLQTGCLYVNGSRQMPVAVLIAQFPKESDGISSVLCFSQMVTLFHEFGHVVHHLCNRSSFARFSGLRMEADFVEICSCMLENWYPHLSWVFLLVILVNMQIGRVFVYFFCRCYENIPLKMMSGHYQDITKPITDDICRALKRRHYSFSALKMKQEILCCLLDQIVHSGENLDIVELLKHLHPKVMLGIPLLEGTNPASCFPRLVVGYESTCYSRIWSQVFATDLFVSKFQNDILSQSVGLQFRNKVYAPGGSKHAINILADFLGREPSVRTFIENKIKNSLCS
ncbi:probable thimet oligopeptidase isoform X2 [Nymphaea colorata]|uniref:probable thimet oligopeptidase isoform X2 n=1 Tax=Nymphaea colorata TaxID=210225 RepID=UPI00214E8CA9|nr:probable thimet oligopeptidase isoform X2 [Nymphaea colorata]